MQPFQAVQVWGLGRSVATKSGMHITQGMRSMEEDKLPCNPRPQGTMTSRRTDCRTLPRKHVQERICQLSWTGFLFSLREGGRKWATTVTEGATESDSSSLCEDQTAERLWKSTSKSPGLREQGLPLKNYKRLGEPNCTYHGPTRHRYRVGSGATAQYF
eukprot:44815-Rhodomonas_salina.2